MYEKMISAASRIMRKEKEMRNASFKANLENTEIPALPVVFFTPLLPHPTFFFGGAVGEGERERVSPFYLSKKHIKSSCLNEKFFEESRILISGTYSACLAQLFQPCVLCPEF